MTTQTQPEYQYLTVRTGRFPTLNLMEKFKMPHRNLWLALALIAGLQTTSAWAQQLTPDQQKIQELERKIEELDRRLSAAEAKTGAATIVPAPIVEAQPAAQTGATRPTNAGVAAGTIPVAEASNAGIVTAGPGGFTMRSADGDYVLKIGADLQTDIRTFSGTGSSSLTDQILLRRVRPTFSGTIYKYVDYFFRPDFGQGSTVIYDAYMQINYIPHFSIRVGKFKPPVGLERLQSDDDTSFIERGLPTLLAPSRDIGFQLSGDLVNKRVGYQVGVFNGVPDNGLSDTSATSHRSYAGRIFATPFQTGGENPLSGLGFGLGAEGGSTDGIALPGYKTAGQNTFFTFASGVTAAGHRTALAPQAFYYLGPFGLLAEDTVTEEQFQKGTVRKDVAFRSWQVEASWILTGEKKSFGSPNPRHPFSLATHGWGAWELAARTGDFKVDQGLFTYGFASPTASPSFAREWVGGVNWYLNRILRISVDYAHTNFLGGAVSADRAAERVILARFQINFI
jgi:phosphate-selective porin OprO/OprP